jgi:GT2 family glycosyltransferase
MRVSAVIPNWNGLHYLRTLFESMAGQGFTEVILVDNGSHDGSAEWAETNGARVIRFGSNRGFAAAVNAGAGAAAGDAIAILNNDVRLDANWLPRLVDALRPQYSLACGKVFRAGSEGQLDATFDALSRAGTALRCGHGRPDGPFWNSPREIRFIPLTAALVRRDTFQSAGGLDEEFESYLEDIDFGLRCAALGIRSIYVPEAVAWHVGSGTLGHWSAKTVRQLSRNQVYLLARHYPADVLRRFAWKIVVGQLLWGVVAARNFRTLVWLFGKLEGLGHFRAIRRPGWHGVAEVVAESERMIRDVQAGTGTDPYWRLYFALTGS